MLLNVNVFSSFVDTAAIFVEDSVVRNILPIVDIGNVIVLSVVVGFLNFFCIKSSTGRLSLVRYIRRTVVCG